MTDVTILFIPDRVGEYTKIYKEYVSIKLDIYNFIDNHIHFSYKNNILLYNNYFKKINKSDKIKDHIFNDECIIFICNKHNYKFMKIKCNLLHNNINYEFNYMYPIYIIDTNNEIYTSLISDLFIYLNQKCNTLVSRKADTYLTLNNKNITMNTSLIDILLDDTIYNLCIVYYNSDKITEILDSIHFLEKKNMNDLNQVQSYITITANSFEKLINGISNISFEELINEIKKEIMDPNNPLEYKNYTYK